MSLSAYIKLVEGSATDKVTIEEVKEKLQRYIEMTSKTGQQLNWNYADAAFPYEMIDQQDEGGKWFYLKGKDSDLYKYILFGVGTEKVSSEDGNGQETERSYIQVVLPDGATHGDRGKANEFCKYLAKEFNAELHLFNGRVMYYNPRK